MNQEKIGKLIKDIRKKNNLTQKDLANKYGVTYQAVSKWENGKNIPDVSLLKEICNDFNIDINDMLDGKLKSKKKNIKLLIILFALFICFIIFLLTHNDSFSFKTLSSQCDKFNITGSIAYNSKKSSIYISNINYCGKKDDKKYIKINCSLYESNNDNVKLISKNSYDKKEAISLEAFLKTLNFKVDNYSRTCKNYNKDSLYLEIKTIDQDLKENSYKIPLSLNDDC